MVDLSDSTTLEEMSLNVASGAETALQKQLKTRKGRVKKRAGNARY
jgi:hypothetical protein